jgi:hypothetical protein
MGSNVKRGLVVEFFGLPGSGKSTIAHELKVSFDYLSVVNKSYEISNMNRFKRVIIKFMYIFTLFLVDFKSSFKSLKGIVGIRQKNFKEKISVITNYFYVISLYKFNKNKHDLHLLDQGILQAVWSILLNSNDVDEKCINNIMSHFELPDIVIIVNVNEDKLLNRYLKRSTNDSRIERGNLTDFENFKKKAADTTSKIIKYLHSKNIQYIEIENNEIEQIYINVNYINKIIALTFNKKGVVSKL